MVPDPIEQAAIDNKTYDKHKKFMLRRHEIKRIDAFEIIRDIKNDNRMLSREIAEIQAVAVIAELSLLLASFDKKDLVDRIATAILSENRKHYDRIQNAIAELQKNALTDEEIEELLR